MKLLYLLRHAKSSWADAGLEDFERPLKRRGAQACALIAAYMERQGIAPDLVLCSTARRARETLDLISRHRGDKSRTRYLDALYMASAVQLLGQVRGVDDAVTSLMVVGHNPGMALLAHTLAGSGQPRALDALAGKFPTAALASFDLPCEVWGEAAPGRAHLSAFVTPRGLA